MKKAQYQTKQRKEMLDFLKDRSGEHFTAQEVCRYFKEQGIPIGTTTVYRHLEALRKEGRIKKYVIDEGSCACFEYLGENGEGDPAVCYHMKCEECGSLIHLECDAITELEDHIWKDHRFRVDPGRTVFYGLCEECEKKGYEELAQERKLER